MQKDKDELTIGVLDIYGFEIFMVSSVLYYCWELCPWLLLGVVSLATAGSCVLGYTATAVLMGPQCRL